VKDAVLDHAITKMLVIHAIVAITGIEDSAQIKRRVMKKNLMGKTVEGHTDVDAQNVG